jgi:hydrogenase maturation protein HypF
MTHQAASPVLVIGYGSMLRGDDAIGRLVVERIADSALPGVVAISTTQLVPELAARIAASRGVIFVDACVTADEQIEGEEIAPIANRLESTHATGPRQLLALTLECYGHAPSAWIVAVPVASVDVSDRLSPKAQINLVPAVHTVERLIDRLRITPACGLARTAPYNGHALERSTDLAARRLILAGGVQGLGVRPAIFRLATGLGLKGTVRNSARGVEVEIEGPPRVLDLFEAKLPAALPHAAVLSNVKSDSIPLTGHAHFAIVAEPTGGPLITRVPQDRAVCSECLGEIDRPGDRRRAYPFTNCTRCGPRYTVIRTMPFERDSTAMDRFPLCDECRREFDSPHDRRFHAQTMACPTCGPQVWCHAALGSERLTGAAAIDEAVRQILAGRIVAARGIGGYQLFVDATKSAAVERLRERKRRRAKPLAVMVESVAAAQALAYLDETELAALCNPSGPIVLVNARAANGLSDAIHPYTLTIGLMLPTTPLHAILARKCRRPLVCTSANREGDPLEYEVASADCRLADVCDLWLHHDREIVRPIDDSVVRVIAGRPVTIRLARGLAPLPLNLPPLTPTIAVGGFLKSAIAWSNGSQAALGPHIGDQQGLAARQRFVDHVADMRQLYRFQAEQLVHDLHPEYFSTQWAQSVAQPARRLSVQHHHAHVAAEMLEHNWLDRQVLGVAWDGTGYGSDGTIWGGEFLVCTAAGFQRVARLRPFSLPGGEAAIHEPWRIALSVCAQLGEPVDMPRRLAWNVTDHQLHSVARIVHRRHVSPLTSSAGRLFDAAAAVILGVERADFDGQAAMQLEAVADSHAEGCYDFPLTDDELPELDWRPLFTGLLADKRRGVDDAVLAMRFHRSLARGIARVCSEWRTMPAILSGGVFQNKLLTELVAEMHNDVSQPLGLPGIIPPNDGGLAAGQLVIAAASGGAASCA